MSSTATIPSVYEAGMMNQYAEELRLFLAEVQDRLGTCKFTESGGLAIRLFNKTGATSVKGTVLMASDSTNLGAKKALVDVPTAIGVFLEDGVADGDLAWVVTSGIAEVYFIGNTTRGQLARTFITGDSGYVAGQALAENAPTSPFASDKHFCEIGHVLESRTGAGLAKILMHFN